MARTEAGVLAGAELVELSEADVPGAVALSEEAGWNQTAQDWSLMIRLGEAFGVRDAAGGLVATGLALPYPPDFGWVSMVLVHHPFRRRGLATRLMGAAVAALRERGLVPLLDATPAGQPVYERLGFRAVEPLTRWRGPGGGAGTSALPPADLPAIRDLDRAAFGADRCAVLEDLLVRGPVSACDPDGSFLLSRPGRTCSQLGPLVARDTEVALRLLGTGLGAIAGPALIDVPDRERAITNALTGRGFQAERPYMRMALGRATGFGDSAAIRALAGPELG